MAHLSDPDLEMVWGNAQHRWDHLFGPRVRWRHRKTGNVYVCVDLSLRESDGEPLVSYKRTNERGGPCVCAPLWTRTCAEFTERFEKVQL